MRRLVAVWALCAAMSAGSFGVLLLEDRRLAVPLPYSVPIAFAAMLGASPLLLILARHLPARERKGRVSAPAPPARTAPVATVARHAAEGVVLLDLSQTARKERAA